MSKIFARILLLSGVCALLPLFISTARAQTETAPEIKKPAAPPDSLPEPKAAYEYLRPRPTYDFFSDLKEAGRRGFRLTSVTALPGESESTAIAGLVKYDGRARYEYTFITVEDSEVVEATLNRLSLDGWRFLDIVTLRKEGRSGITQETTNLYLLERPAAVNQDQKIEKTAYSYKLLKAGLGTGRTPTAKLQPLLDQALTEGFLPVGTYTSISMKGLFSIDVYVGIVTEKSLVPAPKLEYKFIRGNRSEGLRKDLEAFSKEGYRIGVINFNSAVIVREPGQSRPVTYQWLDVNDKTFKADLAALPAKNPVYAAGPVDFSGADYARNILIFETDPAGRPAAEYQFVIMSPRIPKAFKKNPQDYLKTLEDPAAAFQKLLSQNFIPRDLYFSENEGLVALFEKTK